jgi:hypothetical protein
LNDRAHDRQAHSHASALRGEERIKQFGQLLRFDPVAAIAHCNQNVVSDRVGGNDNRTPVFGRVTHGVHCVEDQIHQHLRDPDPIAQNGRSGQWVSKIESNASPVRLRAQEDSRVAYGFINSERGLLDFLSGEERPQAADHLAGPQIITTDVGENRPQVVAPVLVGLKHEVRGGDVAQNRPKGLVDLVGDRAGQFPGDCEPHGARKVVSKFHLRQLSPATQAAFDQQNGDQHGEDKEHDSGQDHLARMCLPQGRFLELHDRVARQRCLADAPTPELAPVDIQRAGHDLGQAQRGRCFAVEQPADHNPGLPPYAAEVRHAPANDARAHECVERTEYRGGRGGRHDLGGLARRETSALAVLEVAGREHDGVVAEFA